ncbi:vomeronasal type-2 receptor 26-like [Hydra vulgaris]|uniref:Vomeronasal type-2 receptor 26-like n=1 Tax=Hydra vulgaris TaxID=6087 RepID=A0ABM4CAD1_HYDVU
MASFIGNSTDTFENKLIEGKNFSTFTSENFFTSIEITLNMTLDETCISKVCNGRQIIITNTDEESTAIISNIVVPYSNFFVLDFNVNNQNLFYTKNLLPLYVDPQNYLFLNLSISLNVTKYIFVTITNRTNEKYHILSSFVQYNDLCYDEHMVDTYDMSYMLTIASEIGPNEETIFIMCNSIESFHYFLQACEKKNVVIRTVILNTITIFENNEIKKVLSTFRKTVNELYYYSQLYNSDEFTQPLLLSDILSIFDGYEFLNSSYLDNYLKQYYFYFSNNTDEYIQLSYLKPKEELGLNLFKCNKICQTGFEQKQILFNSSATKKKNQICEPCVENYFKAEYGAQECRPCPIGQKSNNDKTACISNLTIDLTFRSTNVLIITSFASFSFLLSITIIVILILKRKTPIVKSSNVVLSVIQNLCHLLVALFVPIFYIEKRDYMICCTRHILLGFLLATTTSITFIKTRKYVYIFKKKGRISKKQLLFATSIDLMTMSFILIVQSLLGVILLIKSPPFVDSKINYEKKTITFECTADSQLTAQILYIICLLLISSAQSFHARNLPSYYNETLSIAYSTGICSILLTFYFPIYFGIEDNEERMTAIALLILTVNLIIMTIMFLPKLFVVLFRPEKNNRKSFQAKINSYSQSNKGSSIK